MTKSLTLLDSGLIDVQSLDKVLQSVVFFADSVAIRASFEVRPSDRGNAGLIERRVSELREAGLLRLWSHEYEVDDAGRVRTLAGGKVTTRSADLVVSQTRLRVGLREMDEVMLSMREQAYRPALTGEVPLRQGTAEIVRLRNNLASLVISGELDQDGLLTNPAVRSQLLKAGAQPVGERFEMAVVTDVVSELGLGKLSQLTTEQIVESRKYNADFRELLDDALVRVAKGMTPVITPQATASELARRYRETVASFARPHVRDEALDEVFWDVLGSALPPSIFFKYGFKALRWRKLANEARPFLLLMHLEKSLNSAQTGYTPIRRDS